MKRMLIIAVLWSCYLAGSGLSVAQTASVSSAPAIRVAANLPLSGVMAAYGAAVRDGAAMALDESSNINGMRAPEMRIDWQDNASDPKTAVTVLQRQIAGKPDLYISGWKPQLLSIKGQLSTLGIPNFVYTFDAYINTNSHNNFRTCVSYKIEAPVYLDYAKRRSAKRIAIVYVNLPHSVEEFEKIVIPALREQGIKDILTEIFDLGRGDFKNIALKIAAYHPDLIIMNGFDSDMVGLIRSLRPLGTITDGNTIGTFDVLDAAKNLGADELEGVRVVAPFFETRPDTGAIASFKKRFQQRYNRSPLYIDAFAYDMVLAMRAASREIKLPASHEQWIAALKAVNTQGVTGPIRFDPDGDLLTPVEVGVYRGGRLVPDAQTP